jgi:hypothetical protein
VSSVASFPKREPMLLRPQKSEIAIRLPPRTLDLGTLESACCEVTEHRLMLPMADALDSANARVTLEQDVEVARVVRVDAIGQHLAVNVLTEWRVGGDYPLRLKVAYGGRTLTAKALVVIKHAKPLPFGCSAAVGSQSSSEVPFMGQLWKAAAYRAKLEPALKEFRLTAAKGTMEAGARAFPFRITFAPREPRSVVTLLVVVFNETEEYTVEVTGSVGGFQGRNWGRRVHGRDGVTASQTRMNRCVGNTHVLAEIITNISSSRDRFEFQTMSQNECLDVADSWRPGQRCTRRVRVQGGKPEF